MFAAGFMLGMALGLAIAASLETRTYKRVKGMISDREIIVTDGSGKQLSGDEAVTLLKSGLRSIA